VPPLDDTDITDRLDPSIWKITAVTVIGAFLSQLDATIVNVSISSPASELHTTLATIQWVTSGYLLALTVALPLNGWLVDRLGGRAVYLGCCVAFTLSSAQWPGMTCPWQARPQPRAASGRPDRRDALRHISRLDVGFPACALDHFEPLRRGLSASGWASRLGSCLRAQSSRSLKGRSGSAGSSSKGTPQ
jgi:hypothetical protein